MTLVLRNIFHLFLGIINYWKREFAPEHFSAIVLTKGAAAHNLRDPFAAQEDVSVVCHRGLESLVRRNLSFAAKEALKIARSQLG